MKIQITNTSTVKSESETLQENDKQLLKIKTEIDDILEKIKTYWNENQEDEQKFYGDLKTSSTVLKTIAENSEEFASTMLEYIEYIEKHSQKQA